MPIMNGYKACQKIVELYDSDHNDVNLVASVKDYQLGKREESKGGETPSGISRKSMKE